METPFFIRIIIIGIVMNVKLYTQTSMCTFRHQRKTYENNWKTGSDAKLWQLFTFQFMRSISTRFVHISHLHVYLAGMKINQTLELHLIWLPNFMKQLNWLFISLEFFVGILWRALLNYYFGGVQINNVQ